MQNKSGSYTVKSRYFNIRDSAATPHHNKATSSDQTKSDLWKHIWRSGILPKVRLFLWNACQNALPTVDNLYQRRIVPDPLCPICQKEAETIEHTLLLCPWTAQIWQDNSLVVYLARSKPVHFQVKSHALVATPTLRFTPSQH